MDGKTCHQSTPRGWTCTQGKNLPWLMIRTNKTMEENVMGLQAAVDIAAEKNQNLKSAQKELLHWQQRLCH
eukprot:3732960-Ditylum_brightwellii.AAC.1